MLDVAPSEFLMVAFVALVVIGPKDLPKAMRVVGYWVGRARGVARQFRSGFDAMVREAELEEMEKRWAAENERIMREHGAGSAHADPAPAGGPAEPDPSDVPAAGGHRPSDAPAAGGHGPSDVTAAGGHEPSDLPFTDDRSAADAAPAPGSAGAGHSDHPVRSLP